ncbi:MAG: hypothetical protein JW991_00555 [Candidatus Pacebacteria bacterium]|nr:hypothetical protein [Candidatus Paceibacterota bacterium]
MLKNYGEVRFFLFVNSYSGNKIVSHLKSKHEGNKLLRVSKNLSTVLNFKYKKIANVVLLGVKPKCPYQRLPKLLKIYLGIEKELLRLSEEKLDQYSAVLGDYKRQLLFPAIERVAGDSLRRIEDDHEFDTRLRLQINEYRNIYYKIAYEYRLPTIRIVPFILRLTLTLLR